MNKKGFTLIETLVVSFILVILIGLLSSSVFGIRSIFETLDISVILQADARSAINRIVSDLTKTSRTQINITQNAPFSGSDTLVYHLPLDSDGNGIPDLDDEGNMVWDSVDMMIRLDPSGTNRLHREVGSDIVVLASNVKKVNFIDHNIDIQLYLDELKMILELEEITPKGRVFSLNSTSVINMRN